MPALTTSLATDIGRVRFHLRDLDDERAFFTDAQIQHLLDTAGDWQRAVGEGAKVLLMERARFAKEPALAEYLRGLIDTYGGGAIVPGKVIVTHLGVHPSDPEVP